MRGVLIWTALGASVVIPLAVAANSPLLAWRDPVYIIAGLAGVLGLVFVLVQPLLAAGYLPGVPVSRGRRVHRSIGVLLVVVVCLHVAGLWLTSPPDVIDVLLFRSPTPFSIWGVLAMWAVFAAALLAALRRPMNLTPRIWRLGHTALVAVVVVGTVVHALLIEGTMGTVSKTVLCLLALVAFAKAVFDLRAWRLLRRR